MNSKHDWFLDPLGSWTESYEINKNEEIEADSLTFRTVANDLRKVAEKGRRKGLKLALKAPRRTEDKVRNQAKEARPLKIERRMKHPQTMKIRL